MKFIWQDYLVGIALSLNLISRFITNYLISSTNFVTEANPTKGASASSTSYYFAFVEWVFLIAILLAIYIMVRRNTLKKRTDSWNFVFVLFSIYIFVSLFFDFLNDSSILFGVIFHSYKLVKM
jgi:hypothetical protein